MNLRVLLADDSGTMRKLVARTLAEFGVTDVVEARDGDEALGIFNQNDFDVVLTDWNMPGRNGLQLLEEIRGSGSDVPVVMLTTEADRRQIVAAIDAGVSEYLLKPFSRETRVKLETILRGFAYSASRLRARSTMNVDLFNPFLLATLAVFDMSLKCPLRRKEPFLKDHFQPQHDVTGVTNIAGKAQGTLGLSLSRGVALRSVGAVTGTEVVQINDRVVDVVRELTNTIAGNAQGQFKLRGISITPPIVLIGRSKCIDFPSNVKPVCVPFTCEWGPVAIEVGIELKEPALAPGA